jgi:hypothetical protein
MSVAFVETYSGVKFFPLDPKPRDIKIMDIASGLSKICRYNGQCKIFFSVAQHSLNCMDYARRMGYSKRIQLLALLHDAAEAYVSDIASPIKPLIPLFGQIENNILKTIHQAFGIVFPNASEWKVIKEIDTIMLATEAFQIMPMRSWDEWIYHVERDQGLTIEEKSIDGIRTEFVEQFTKLNVGTPKKDVHW